MQMTNSDDRIAVLVHEVRSPVAALTAIADAMGETDGPDRAALVRLGLVACTAIERLATDITVASVRPTRVDIGAIVRDAAMARVLAGHTVEVEVDASLEAVQGDPVRLRQALDNLLTNAFVHAGLGGVVEVNARNADAGVTVSVSDSGPGIPAEELGRIFDPGVRLDASRRSAGLGLAITKAIVDAHGGSLTVESPPGRGATFTMTLLRGDRHPDT